MPVEIAKGLFADTVGDILGDTQETPPPAPRVSPPRLEGQPPFPPPGIYFGMPEDTYHSIHACSASGLKKLMVSSMDYWASSPLNPELKDKEDSIYMELGRAYHARICEGPVVFEQRYCIGLDKSDYGEDLCVTTDDIRKAIEAIDVKPKGTRKSDLIDQLRDAYVDAQMDQPPVWDEEVADHKERNEDKVHLPRKQWNRIQIAARMIEADPNLAKAFTGGHAEVSLFWYDEVTGAPCKARLDYLKLQALVDLKSFSNMAGRPIERAIDFEIANRRYYIPVAFYLKGIAAVKQVIKGTPLGHQWESVFGWHDGEPVPMLDPDVLSWIGAWQEKPEPKVLFVFQQTGAAPVTRGRLMTTGSVYTVNKYAVEALMRKWVLCATTYGTEPWLDLGPVRETVDEEIPLSASDFGEQL